MNVALAKTDPRQTEIKASLERAKGVLAKTLPSVMTADRQIRITMLAVSKQPKLLECSPISILQACLHASQLGLEFGSPLGHAYPVPYWNAKKRCLECQCIVGYKGLIDLAMRSGDLQSIEAHAVYAADYFDFAFGLTQRLEHRPSLGTDRGELIAAYALVRYKEGGVQFDVMSRAEIDAIRLRMRPPSEKAPQSPWDTDYGEMARKTVIRRLSKSLRLKIEAATQLADALDKTDLRDEEVIEIDSEAVAEPKLGDKIRASAEPPTE